MSRTGENIYERKDGRFEGRYIKFRNENGKAIYAYVYGKSKAEVREKVRLKKRERAGAEEPWKEVTFREAAERWLAAKHGTLAASTLGRYRKELEKELYPEYGDTPLAYITYEEAERYRNKAKKAGKGAGRGRLVSGTVLESVLDFMRKGEAAGTPDREGHGGSHYESLTPKEILRVCRCAEGCRTSETLAALLGLFCGLRVGEACALEWGDISLEKGEIRIRRTAQRIGLPEGSETKTELKVMDIPWKTQVRKAAVPEVLLSYIGSFPHETAGVLGGSREKPFDPRTLQRRLGETFGEYGIKGVNFQRLRKTYAEGKADTEILSDVFSGRKAPGPYRGELDKGWLRTEMARDLDPLRRLAGLSAKETGEILGVSEAVYRNIEDGRRSLGWQEFLALLFLFRFNPRTGAVVDVLGLFPEPLKAGMQI